MDEKRHDKFRITIEPILFGLVFSMAQGEGVITNLFLRQACHYHGYSVENCTGEAQILAQKQISYIETWKLIIENLFPSFLSFFSGPWSNENGRKFILNSSVTGYGLFYFSWGILSFIEDLHPAYFLFCSVPLAFSGGMVGVLLSSLCYIADITRPKSRALRIGFAELVINLAQLSGYFLVPCINKVVPNTYWVPFLINSSICSLCLIYSIFFLPESVELKPDRNRTFIRVDHFKMTIKTMTKKRENHERAVIFICILLSILNLVTIFGETPIKYLSLIKAFDWKLNDYSTYNVIILTLLALISTFALVVLHKILKMPDNLLLLVTFVTKSVSGFLMAVAMNSSFFYFASILGSLRGVVGPIVKSIVSHIIRPEEVGVLFSFFSSIECLTPLFAAPIYNIIYASLVSTAPLAIYFVSFWIYAVGVLAILLNIYFMRSRKTQGIESAADSGEVPKKISRS